MANFSDEASVRTPLLKLDVSSESLDPNARSYDSRDGRLLYSSSPNLPRKSPFHLSNKLQSHHAERSQKAVPAQNESRKLFALLLDQLERRPKPPSIFNILGAHHAKERKLMYEDSDVDESHPKVFHTDHTFELMAQLEDVLILSSAQGWQIFDDSTFEFGTSDHRGSFKPSSSPFRLNRNSLRVMGRPSRSRSRSPAGRRIEGSSLLTRCISVLSSVISDDCRFHILSPKPSRPPNALQSISLDIAQFLAHIHWHNPIIVSQIGFAVIPAFDSFPLEMHPRLLAFFEDGLLRGILHNIREKQGTAQPQGPSALKKEQDVDFKIEAPTVSIQVDEVPDDAVTGFDGDLTWHPWTSIASTGTSGTVSTRAPNQSLHIYYLSSLISPLLASLLNSVDLSSSSGLTTYRVRRLIDALINAKDDSYLDILDVVAYHSPKARLPALCLLSTYWPRAFGHTLLSKPLFLPTSQIADTTSIKKSESRQSGHPFTHQFVPWQFMSASPHHIPRVTVPSQCHACSKHITEFGLLCPFCMCAVHFDCYDYPEGTFEFEYPSSSDLDMRKIAVHRFCYVLPARRGLEFVRRKGEHFFRPVNIFTLSLCSLCHQPVWGLQGLHCDTCGRFTHSSCANQDSVSCHTYDWDFTRVTVDVSVLQRTFTEYYGDIIIPMLEESRKTYEDISVLLSVLWSQLRILENGLALGSIVVEREPDLVTLELRQLVQRYRDALSTRKLQTSLAIDEYLRDSSLDAPSHAIMFDWSILIYMTSLIKCPLEPQISSFNNSSSELLQVTQTDFSIDAFESTDQPFEVVSIAHMRDALGYEFNIFFDPAARHCLAHLHTLGFFDFKPTDWVLPQRLTRSDAVNCEFALPLGFDSSTDVETLTVAIEACLSDIDLSVNEGGLILLLRKFWPSAITPLSSLRRLGRALLCWLFDEDESLATVLRDWVSKGRTLPGIPTDPLPWPSRRDPRRGPGVALNNGGDYVASRRALSNRYVVCWLSAFHDLDALKYTNTMYTILMDLAEDSILSGSILLDEKAEIDEKTLKADKVLRFIIKMIQNSVIFDTFDEIFAKWLEYATKEDPSPMVISSLQRLFALETDATIRSSTVPDANITSKSATVDPWRIVRDVARKSKQHLIRCLSWLSLFARSGVDVSVRTYIDITSQVKTRGLSLADCCVFVEAAFLSTWSRSLGRQDQQVMFYSLHSHLAPEMLQILNSSLDTSLVIRFVRQSLAACLLLYGCERETLTTLRFLTEEDIKRLPSRRKIAAHGSAVTDPIIMDSAFVHVLKSYVETNTDELVSLVAKFLHAFMSQASFLESYEVDNFVLRNGNDLSVCAWQFYGNQRYDLSNIRISVLLRILVVDSEPFQAILQNELRPQVKWESRFSALMRLFRMLLDVINPAFHVEGRQWGTTVLDVFYHYFSAIWADEKEEIRMAVDAWSQTLLPAHFEAIARCWNESISKVPVVDRIRLVSFLIQLHPHFPRWQVLSWDAIIDALFENDNTGEEDPAAAHLSMYGISFQDDDQLQERDPDMSPLRVSIVLLSLQMLASGMAIDAVPLFKIKLHLVKILGFSDVGLVPAPHGRTFYIQFGELESIPEDALSCVNALTAVLDAHHTLELPPSAMNSPFADEDATVPVLIGSAFVDVLLKVFCAIKDPLFWPILTVKSLLESLMIIVLKHDFESRPLKHLDRLLRQALRKALDLSARDISYELRQLTLSVIHAYVKRWSTISGSFVVESVEKMTALIMSLKNSDEDILVVQARAFVEHTLTRLSQGGIFHALCKRDLDSNFFIVLKHITDANAKLTEPSGENLRNTLLRSVILQPPESDLRINQTFMTNVHKYVEVVYHDGYSEELMSEVGAWLAAMARRISGSSTGPGADLNHLLFLSAILLENNRRTCRPFLVFVENVTRIALSRSTVNAKALTQLLQITSSLYKTSAVDAHAGTKNQLPINHIAFAVWEVLDDGLRMKARIWPSTLTAIVEASVSADIRNYAAPDRPYATLNFVLASNSLYFLQSHVWSTDSANEMAASLAIAKLILRLMDSDLTLLSRALADQFERSSRKNMAIRAWNILVLAALMSSEKKYLTMLFSEFPAFATAYYGALNVYVASGSVPPKSAAADIDHAYIAVKLWLMLADRQNESLKTRSLNESPCNPTEFHNAGMRLVWNELWPLFESLVDSCKADADAGGSISPMVTTIFTSVADLFLFLHQSHSELAFDTLPQTALLARLKTSGRQDSAMNKLSRALRGESLPEIQPEALVLQAEKDIESAEKLRVLDMDLQRPPLDRNRREMRLST